MDNIVKIKVGNNKYVSVRKNEKKYFVGHDELNKEIDKIIFPKHKRLKLRRNK